MVDLFEYHEEQPPELAALLWNAREPIHKEAFELVNKLIVSAVKKVGS